MIGRFREREVLMQFVRTATAGALVAGCWALRLWHPQPTVEAVLALTATILSGGPIVLGAVQGRMACS